MDNRPELTGTTREKLLSTIENSDLLKEVNELYRPGATTGDGGTAAKLMEEINVGNSKHLQKAAERLGNLKDIAKSGDLGLNDLDIIEALILDLEDAINLLN